MCAVVELDDSRYVTDHLVTHGLARDRDTDLPLLDTSLCGSPQTLLIIVCPRKAVRKRRSVRYRRRQRRRSSKILVVHVDPPNVTRLCAMYRALPCTNELISIFSVLI